MSEMSEVSMLSSLRGQRARIGNGAGIGAVASLGYPGSEDGPELGRLLESYRSGQLHEKELQQIFRTHRLRQLQAQSQAGVDYIPVGDTSLHNPLLDQVLAFGLLPRELYQAQQSGSLGVQLSTYPDLTLYSDLVFGRGDLPAWDSTASQVNDGAVSTVLPWRTNCLPELTHNYWLDRVLEAPPELKNKLRPVLVGPYTFASLLHTSMGTSFELALRALIPVYARLLDELEAAGVYWVQFNESDMNMMSHNHAELLREAYSRLHLHGPAIMLQTSGNVAEVLTQLLELPVGGIGLDFIHDGGIHLDKIVSGGFPVDKVLGVGIIDSKTACRADLSAAWKVIEQLTCVIAADKLILQPTSSLASLPLTAKHVTTCPPLIRLTLAYAAEKLSELGTLARGLQEGKKTISLDLADSDVMLQALAASS